MIYRKPRSKGKLSRIRRTEKRKSNVFKVMSWNIEGAAAILKTTSENRIFVDNDIIMLCETFATQPIHIPGYQLYISNAIQESRGRPRGGLIIAVKNHIDSRMIEKEPNVLIVETSLATVVNCYFPPLFEEHEMVEIITGVIHKLDVKGPIIFGGDFNSRIDQNCEKGENLLHLFEINGFKNVVPSNQYTYFSHNGRSTIDLVFVNNRCTHVNTLIVNPIVRKHQQVITTFYNKSNQHASKSPSLRSKPRKRSIDQEKLYRLIWRTHIKQFIFNLEIDQCYQTLQDILKQAGKEPQYYHGKHKIWFDSECQLLKKTCLELAKVDLTAYSIKRKEYKALIKEKRTIHIENEIISEIEKKVIPWKLFKKQRLFRRNEISMSSLVDHFTHIYCKSRVTCDLTYVNDKQWCDDLWNQSELDNAIASLKKGKASGSDAIFNEYIIESYDLLRCEWLMLFSRCLLQAQIPQCWRHGLLYTLYKGKGDVTLPDSYRGISLQQSMFKVFTKLLNSRIMQNCQHLLPTEQYGFVPGRKTADAIKHLRISVENSLSKPRGKLYACFIDFAKAFDTVDRDLLLQKLNKKMGITGRILRAIENILETNKIQITNDSKLSDAIFQSTGLIQGDSLSPSLFILYIADIVEAIKVTTKKLDVLLYADDLVFFSENVEDIQSALRNLVGYCDLNKLVINENKSEIVKFRKGGHLSSSDIFHYGQKRLQVVNCYDYLGVTFQTKLKFTKHIQKRKKQATNVVYSLKNLPKLSVKVGLNLFKSKVQPIIAYSLESIASHLTLSNLLEIDKVKAAYLKRLLGTASNASSTLMYQLCGCETLVSDISQTVNFDPDVYAKYLHIREIKNWTFVTNNYTAGPGFQNLQWQMSNQINRSKVIRTTVHGFHHEICSDQDFHLPNEICVCKLCGGSASDRYHLLDCKFY